MMYFLINDPFFAFILILFTIIMPLSAFIGFLLTFDYNKK